MSARMVPRLVICLGMGALVAGCGAGQSRVGLTAAAARRLQSDLTAVRTAAERQDRQAADTALARFSAGVRRATRDGQLSRAEERRLAVGVAQARRHVSLDVVAPASPSSTETGAQPSTQAGGQSAVEPQTHTQPLPALAPAPPAPKEGPGKGPKPIPPGHARHGDQGQQQGEGGG